MCQYAGTMDCPELQRHSLFLCEQCQLLFKRCDDLKFHNDKIHLGLVFSCKHCDSYSTARKSGLVRHINLKHQDQGLERIRKPIVCKEEGCTFVSVYGNLKRHIETKHEGIVRFKCHVMNCSFGSVKQAELRKHIRTHAGESAKIYKCNQCDYASVRAGNLRLHLKTHTRDESHKCNQCEYAAVRAAHLKRHLKIHLAKKITQMQPM